ncbi:MAG: hypothetical protein ACI4OR_03685 [Alphaproteobacteria bacterium]
MDIVKYAGDEAEPILNYLISLKDIHIKSQEEPQDPFVLLDQAGYNAYYVHNLAEQNAISKYFEPDEELCTFRDPIRFQKYHIINAVKKDVDKIKREDFRGKEQREDLYGTSVISIQVLTTGGFISIKNRYNHTVSNPDNTFNSNPDNIIPGLSAAIKKYLGVDFSSQEVLLPDHFVLMNNQLIRYHHESCNMYFGDRFYAKDGHIHPLESHEIMMDDCILNLRDRTIYDPSLSPDRFKIDDEHDNSGSFMSVIANELKGKKLQIKKNKEEDCQEIYADDVCLIKVQKSQVKGLYLPKTTKINGRLFLFDNKILTELDIPNLEAVEDWFLGHNTALRKLNLPNLKKVGDYFLFKNNALTELHLPKLEEAEEYCLDENTDLKKASCTNILNNTIIKVIAKKPMS